MIGRHWLRTVRAAAGVATAGTAFAAGTWEYLEDSSGLLVARIDPGDTAFEISCDENSGDIFADYYLDTAALHADLKGKQKAIIAITFDNEKTIHWQEVGLYVDNSYVSIGMAGGSAEKMAKAAAAARTRIVVAIALQPPAEKTRYYNLTEFPVKGSSAAIKKVYAECDLTY